MNQIDPDKEWRLQRETETFDLSWVESLGERLLKFLEGWANKEIFDGLQGHLKVNIPTGTNPNARVTVPKGRPLEPTMEVRLSLLLQIYKDAFAFPLISKRIQKEMSVLQELNGNMFKGAKFTFDSAVPEISPKQLIGPLFMHATAVAQIVHDRASEKLDENDVYCRFLMFEIMLAWTFFHELAHVLQQHHAVRERLGEPNAASEHIDELSGDSTLDSNLFGQAREILADAEGIHLTLEYLAQGERLNYATTYLLLCALSCMFQQFYNSHEAHLGIVSGQHPHPVIRDEFSQITVLNWVKSYLLASKAVSTGEDAAIPLAYLNVRASVMSGIYRAHRIEKIDSTRLPSYMALQSRVHDSEFRVYMQKMVKHIKHQLPIISELHVRSTNGLASLIEFVERFENKNIESDNDSTLEGMGSVNKS